VGTKMKKSQDGFSAVEGLLIAVIVGMLGGVGWYVWHSQQQADETYSQTANSTATPKTKKTSSSTTNKDLKYLEVKEWSVKFSLSSNVEDAVYRTSTIDPGFAFLSTNSLKGTSCDVNNNGGGYYLRFQAGQINSESKKYYADEYPDATHLGAYYYAYGMPEAAISCSSDSAIQQKATKAADEFKKAVSTVQASL
jgi:type II secretory pathway pseudopilin PulG